MPSFILVLFLSEISGEFLFVDVLRAYYKVAGKDNDQINTNQAYMKLINSIVFCLLGNGLTKYPTQAGPQL